MSDLNPCRYPLPYGITDEQYVRGALHRMGSHYPEPPVYCVNCEENRVDEEGDWCEPCMDVVREAQDQAQFDAMQEGIL